MKLLYTLITLVMIYLFCWTCYHKGEQEGSGKIGQPIYISCAPDMLQVFLAVSPESPEEIGFLSKDIKSAASTIEVKDSSGKILSLTRTFGWERWSLKRAFDDDLEVMDNVRLQKFDLDFTPFCRDIVVTVEVDHMPRFVGITKDDLEVTVTRQPY